MLNGSFSNLALTVTASADLTAERFASLSGAAATAAAGFVGVVRNDIKSGDGVTLDVAGIVTVVAGAEVAAGALVEVGTGGKAITRASGVAVGRAFTAAAGDGAKFSVILTPGV